MNIGLLLGTTFVGGMERQAAYLSEGFIEKGHPTFVYVGSLNVSLKPRSKVKFPKGILYNLWGTRYTEGITIELLKIYCRIHKIDILIGFQVGAIEICNIVKGFVNNLVVIGNIRGTKFATDPTFEKRYQDACKQTDGIITNSTAVLRMINERILGNSKIPSEFIPNIVKIPPAAASKSDNVFRILFAGSLTQVKDPYTFLKGAILAMKKNPRISVWIAGDGPLRNKMEDYVRAKGLESKITFLGSVKPEEVPYQQAHLVISSSLREASSNTILEALAHGACVIGTEVGGTVELLKSKPFGRLIQTGDYNELAREILKFSTLDPGKIKEKGEKARSFYSKKLSEGNNNR